MLYGAMGHGTRCENCLGTIALGGLWIYDGSQLSVRKMLFVMSQFSLDTLTGKL
jgi:hypothetical protein